MNSHSDSSVPAHRGQDSPHPVSETNVTLRGVSPSIAGAQLSLDGERILWNLDSQPIEVGAGSGIAAAIVDLIVTHTQLVSQQAASVPSSSQQRERSIPVDQTHTSVIVDEKWVVKIVGAWGASDRSAAILDRLKKQHATVSPELAGAVHWEHPEFGTTAIALVTEYVPNSSDGWTWAVEDTLDYLAQSKVDPQSALPDWPEQLGVLTAHMHTALVLETEEIPDEDPRANDRVQAETVFADLFATIDSDTAAKNSNAFNDAAFLQRMRARKSALASVIRTIPKQASGPLLIPHGDYHVGQLLRTRDGKYMVLDFDGDPQWDAARRLRPDGASRDVAHMLVSFDIVAAVVQRRLGHADERVWRWASSAQQQFLKAYQAHTPEGFLDTQPLRGLVGEQLLHELLYAEHFLPRWKYGADGAITRRYPTDPALIDEQFTSDELYFSLPEYIPTKMEQPWNPPVSPTT